MQSRGFNIRSLVKFMIIAIVFGAPHPSMEKEQFLSLFGSYFEQLLLIFFIAVSNPLNSFYTRSPIHLPTKPGIYFL